MGQTCRCFGAVLTTFSKIANIVQFRRVKMVHTPMPQLATKARNERSPSAQAFAADSIFVNFLHARKKNQRFRSLLLKQNRYAQVIVFCSTRNVVQLSFRRICTVCSK